MAYIYLTTNLINNKKYIGKREKQSNRDFWYLGSGNAIKAAVNKYGKENFKKEIIVEGDFNKYLLDELEKHYIQLHAAVIRKDYYNLSSGGKYGDLAAAQIGSVSKRREDKIYQYNKKGIVLNTFCTFREAGNFLNVYAGCIEKHTKKDKYYKKLNCYFTRNKELIRARNEDILIKKGKSCVLYDTKFNILKTYNTLKECSLDLNITHTDVSKCCQNRSQTSNYIIRYRDDKQHTRIFVSKKFNGVSLYNEFECLIFFSLKEAAAYVNTKYGITSNTSSTLISFLKKELKYKDYNVRTLWSDRRMVADKMNKLKKDKVIEYTLTGDIINIWKSSVVAANNYGYDQSGIRHACRGKLKTYKNRIWKYETK